MTDLWPVVDGNKETFTFHIDDISHMLVAPERDIFSERPHVFMGVSVVDKVLDHLENEKALKRKEHRLVLVLPPEKVTPGMTAKCEAALDRYTEVRIKDNRFHMASLRRQAYRQLPYSLLFLTACVLLGIFISSGVIGFLPPWASTVIGEGLFIVGWVAIWGPADLLLFSRIPLIRQNQALRAMGRMTVEVREGTPLTTDR